MESLGTNRGVRKVSEKITEQGRTLIITETNNDKLNWGLIPDGTLHVDPVTGAMSVKLFGESNLKIRSVYYYKCRQPGRYV